MSLKRPWPFSEDHSDSACYPSYEGLPNQLQESQSWQLNGNRMTPPFENTSGRGLFQDLGHHVPHSQLDAPPFASHPQREPVEEVTLEENRELCYGTLVDIKTQLKNGNITHGGCSMSSGKSSREFGVTQEGEFFFLMDAGTKVALLNKRSCQDLKAVVDCHQLHFKAFIQSREWTSAVRDWKKNKSSTLLTTEINLYGARKHADEIGQILSESATFLQQPCFGLNGGAYYNPHYFRLPGYSDVESPYTPMLSILDPVQSTPTDTRQEESNPSAEVSSILDSLSHHGFLCERVADTRIRSPLLPHQKEAIDFIFRRETGQLPDELSLWRYNDTDSDEPFYQHAISGAKRSQPAEAKAGILGDDMGLGKTLVILSTIAGSLDRGAEFVRSESSNTKAEVQPTAATRATLIIAPSSLLVDSWIDEIRKHTYPGYLSFHKYHGQGRQADEHLLYSCDIIFTTYATVAAEFGRGGSILAKVKWFRIVLDEAHDVRNRSTKQFQAVADLSAQHRWCLTGTPIQNTLEDLGALVAFLQVPLLESAPTFRKYIASQSTSNSRDRFSSLRMLLGTICLRRTRDLLHLPEPVPQIRKLSLTSSEQAEYDEILSDCRKAIDVAVSGHRKAKLNSTVLESLLKLRLFCNNGSTNRAIQTGPNGLPFDTDEALSFLQQSDQAMCAYCYGAIYSINEASDTDGGKLMVSCPHLVCHSCIPQHYADLQRCPICALAVGHGTASSKSENLTVCLQAQVNPLVRAEGNPHKKTNYPSKLLAFVADIQRQTSRKSIAFSSWKKTLNLIEELLTERHLRFYCIDGSLSLPERGKVLKRFRSDAGANILLMTLGTGAVGLNLAVASRIYLLEPQWNPSIELQAIGRALRLGQTDQVTIVRYIMKNTVEESNVLSRQNAKLQLAGGGFAKGKSSMPSERFQSLMGVFGINAAE